MVGDFIPTQQTSFEPDMVLIPFLVPAYQHDESDMHHMRYGTVDYCETLLVGGKHTFKLYWAGLFYIVMNGFELSNLSQN